MDCCPSVAHLTRFLAEELDDAERQRLEAHVESCPDCLRTLQRLATAEEGAGSPPSGPLAAGEERSGHSFPCRLMRTPPWVQAPGPSAGLTLLPSGKAGLGTGPPEIVGYEVFGELGRGGMGVVYKARHLQLNRLVALKMIRPGGRPSAEELSRFRTEAEAVARLQHPNVVQIYEIGEHDGLPYLALEYCGGGTLAQRLGGTPLPPHPAADLVEVLARAMHTAHARGLIHRDLKPANVLLSPPVGESLSQALEGTPRPGSMGIGSSTDWETPKITDFGLAKLLDRGAGLTATEHVLGTPSYMAPEQAGRHKHAVGPPADVYALGAVLYECLTGRPPFKGATPLETVAQVVCDEPVPPRRLQPAVPRDLETVCLKCLEKDPGRRCASAAELAQDLGRFREGVPVHARPARPWERLGKWARRSPARAALVAVSLLALAAGLVGGLWHNAHLGAALRDAEAQRNDAQAQRDKARERLKAEAAVVDRFFTKVSESRELRAKGAEPLRQNLLKLAAEYYEAFVQEPDHDPDLEGERGRAYGRLAVLNAEIGNLVAAEADHERGIAVLAGLVGAYPDEPRYRADLATAQHNLGDFYVNSSRAAEAEPLFQAAGQLWEKLSAQDPEKVRYALGLGASYNGLGRVYRRTRRPGQAAEAFEAALRASQRVADRHPEEPKYLAELALDQNNLGSLYAELREQAKAQEHLAAAAELWDRLVTRQPGEVTYQYRQALAHQNLGALHLEQADFAESQRRLGRAEEVWAGLAKQHPLVTRYAAGLGGTRTYLGELARVLGDLDKARGRYDGAIRLLEDLLRRQGPNDTAMAHLLNARAGRAEALTALGKVQEAERDWDRAAELDRKLGGRQRDRLAASRALTQAAGGDHRGAAAAALRLAGNEKQYGEFHFVAARVCSIAAVRAGADVALAADERPRRAAAYVDQGWAMLSGARDLDFFRLPVNVHLLKMAPDLAPLRQREAFRQLVAEVEARPQAQ